MIHTLRRAASLWLHLVRTEPAEAALLAATPVMLVCFVALGVVL